MTGVPPSGSGRSPKGEAACSTASPAKPSVPNAEELAARWATLEFQREMAVERFLCRTGHMMRMVRLHRGYTIEELAAKSQVTPRYIRLLERGELSNASIRSLALMAFALGVELELKASAIEAPSGVETGNTDSTEGESATLEEGDAQ